MYVLNNQHIDIWFFPLTPWVEEAEKYLSCDETKRAQQFYFQRHRQRFSMARATMRVLLARYLSVSPLELEFQYLEHGKPYLSNHQEITFNLSHSDNWALLGVGKKYALGVDIEIFSERPYQGIGKHVFSSQENKALSELQDPLKPLGFFNMWSQKEALIKACGLGLSYNTTQFTVAALPQKKQLIWDEKHQQSWQMNTFMPRIGCSAALCCNEKIQTIDYRTVLPATLLIR